MLARTIILLSLLLGAFLNSRAQDVFFVKNLNDSGTGSLRAALAQAQEADLIIIAVTGDLVLQSPLFINEAVYIQAPMPMHFALDGSVSGAIIDYQGPNNGATCAIDGMAFVNGSHAITAQTGQLHLGHCVFDGNFTTGADGAAINTHAAALVSVDNSSFLHNTSDDGGAIMNQGSMAIANCTFYDNDALFNGGAIYHGGSELELYHNTFYFNDCSDEGGAIYTNNSVTNSTGNLFYQNGQSSTSLDGNIDAGNGGLYASMGGNFLDSDLTNITSFWTPGTGDVINLALNPMITGAPIEDGYGLWYCPFTSGTSPAIDIGDSIPATPYDQRRGYRVMRGNIQYAMDAGSIEYTPFIVTTLNGTPNGVGAPAGSLGWAINGANTAPSPPYSIVFDMVAGPPHEIQSTGTYTIVRECIIDGYTQIGTIVPGPADPSVGDLATPGLPAISIYGGVVNPSGDAFRIEGGSNQQIRGLSIYEWGGSAIAVTNAGVDVLIEGCHLGTDESGTANGLGNETGVTLMNATTNCQIGDAYYHSRNVIVGNNNEGISIRGAGTIGNEVYNNFIGVDAFGDAELGNEIGVIIEDSASLNKIGDSLYFRNIISGNDLVGVIISDTLSDANGVYGNFIGTDVSGLQAIPNHKGIVVDLESNINVVGGATRWTGNLVSGNDSTGIETSSWGTFIYNNYVGVDVTGLAPLANGADGILISGNSSFHAIGGVSNGNLVSGNQGHGICCYNMGAAGIVGNRVGIAADTSGVIPNLGDGIRLDSSCWWVGIGSNQLEGFNTVCGNNGHGIHLSNTSGLHNISGNFIGTAIFNGNLVNYGNQQDGIHINENSFFNSIIGDSLSTGEVNFIAYNGGNGITIINDEGNRMYRNMCYDNGGLGIDLANDGVTGIDTTNLDMDSGANSLLNAPIINNVTSCSNGVIIDGELYSHNNKPFRIEFFVNEFLDPTGHGEGEFYIGQYEDSTDAAGHMAFNVFVPTPITTPIPAGWFVTATSTIQTIASNTSEFSQGTVISAGATAPVAQNDTTICYPTGGITLSATAAANGSLVWAYDPGFTMIIDTNGTILSDTAQGSYAYYVAEIMASGCLSDADSIKVDIVAPGDPTFMFDDFCAGEPNGAYGVVTAGGAFSFNPQPGDGGMINGSTGEISGETPGSFYTVQYITPGPCPDTSTLTVQALQLPEFGTIDIYNEQCEGDLSGAIDATATGTAPPLSFTIDGGLNFQSSGLFQGLTAATYVLEVVDDNGCSNNTQIVVQANVPNSLVVNATEYICLGESIQLDAQGPGPMGWTIPGSLDTTFGDPTVQPDSTTLYHVILFTSGCIFVDTIIVFVDPATNCLQDVYNAFSPDGDGTNDVWIIPAVAASTENTVYIYNRWGDIIKTIHNYNNTTEVWDGTGSNNKPLPNGTYFYMIELRSTETPLAGWVQITK